MGQPNEQPRITVVNEPRLYPKLMAGCFSHHDK